MQYTNEQVALMAAAELFRGAGTSARFNVTDDADRFLTWLNQNGG